jgi:ornithine lipid ester-linked acyl 2-hydroxylase
MERSKEEKRSKSVGCEVNCCSLTHSLFSSFPSLLTSLLLLCYCRPEDHFTQQQAYTNNRDWTVFPLLYTFPAYNESKITWVGSTCAALPETTALLKRIPNIRTALFSKLGPETELSSHTGWEDLANYVLRCHICLDIPQTGLCGLHVEDEEQYHKNGHVLVFDDSKNHWAFNYSDTESRTVLIVDLMRPKHIPLGRATGGHTDELDSFMTWFR